jgi:hypothetical protein
VSPVENQDNILLSAELGQGDGWADEGLEGEIRRLHTDGHSSRIAGREAGAVFGSEPGRLGLDSGKADEETEDRRQWQ